ncbi:ribosomal protein S18-alanine N-acetyltransferase [Legionella dresdenensis]|uniref:[Ribosomal protein bS18]-alanine N-acetyltransferase n=1 Tax=Legionella dresdenensis TaxID=450200 RepID=A0ABV8CBU2_9GAMM
MMLHDIEQVYLMEEEGHVTPWTREILIGCLLIGFDCKVIGLAENTKLIGYIISRRVLNVCHVLNLCVDREYRRKGIGERLLTELIESLPKPAIEQVILEVRVSNAPAIQLYEKLGFEHDGYKQNYYNDDAGYEDALVLKKQLNCLL